MNEATDPIPAAEHRAAVATARAEGAAEAVARIRSILTCANAAGREIAAIDMALDEETTFSAASANKMLGHMPKGGATASAAGGGYLTVEQRSQQPGFGFCFDPADAAPAGGATSNPIAEMIRRSAGKE